MQKRHFQHHYLIEEDHLKGDEEKNVHYQTMFDRVLALVNPPPPGSLSHISFRFLLSHSWP